MTNPLIPIVSGQINGQPTLTVDARELHACLGVAAHFKDWIVRRIDDYGFIENQDFEVLLKFEQNPKGPTRQGIQPFLDMAKELAMVERTDKGRMVRRYFIDCERLARGQQADLSKLKAQRDALFAWLLELKPELGKIARFRRAGLNRLETARALGWGEKRVRLAETKLAAAGLLPPRESPTLAAGGLSHECRPSNRRPFRMADESRPAPPRRASNPARASPPAAPAPARVLAVLGPERTGREGRAVSDVIDLDPETRRLRALKAKVVRVFQEADAETRETRLAALLDRLETLLDRLDRARAP